jgi:hypothetical protein
MRKMMANFELKEADIEETIFKDMDVYMKSKHVHIRNYLPLHKTYTSDLIRNEERYNGDLIQRYMFFHRQCRKYIVRYISSNVSYDYHDREHPIDLILKDRMKESFRVRFTLKH